MMGSTDGLFTLERIIMAQWNLDSAPSRSLINLATLPRDVKRARVPEAHENHTAAEGWLS